MAKGKLIFKGLQALLLFFSRTNAVNSSNLSHALHKGTMSLSNHKHRSNPFGVLPVLTQQKRKMCQNNLAKCVATSLRGGGSADLISSSYDWAVNLGAPAALVAGAVVATLYEKKGSSDLVAKTTDAKWVVYGKRSAMGLLLMAFALELVSIFVTTVTGTMLLSVSAKAMEKYDTTMESSLVFLKENFEFEYLTSRITFLQGLLCWIGGIAIDFAIPNDGVGPAAIKMNKAIAGFLATTIFMMLSFYNGHMSFYENYADMLSQWVVVTWKRYIWRWPMRPASVLIVPAILYTTYWSLEAFFAEPDE